MAYLRQFILGVLLLTCGLLLSSQVYSLGDKSDDELGNRYTTYPDSSLPLALSTPNKLTTQNVATAPSIPQRQAVFSKLSAGSTHGCGLTTDGTAYCWGNNEFGALGDGSKGNSSLPVAVAAPLGESHLKFSSIFAGGLHTCGLTVTSKAYCWGNNEFGELGNNSTIDSSIPVAVVAPSGLGSWTLSSISADGLQTCGLTANGTAYCWGSNGQGQLGNGNTTNSSVPVAVAAPEYGAPLVFSSLTTSTDITCGLTKDGSAYCWGDNWHLGLGGENVMSSSLPVRVGARRDGSFLRFSSLWAGGPQTCGLTLGGNAYCWGENEYGGLGNGKPGTFTSSSPVAVAAPQGGQALKFVQLSNSSLHSCGLIKTGNAYCWGQNRYGQLGNDRKTNSSRPVAVLPPKGGSVLHFSTIFAGGYFTCGLTLTGITYCWGDNRYGQLGNLTTTGSALPVMVEEPNSTTTPSFSSFTVGLEHLCGLTAQGTAYCWGQNSYGQLGNSTIAASSSPVAVAAPSGEQTLSFSSLTAGAYHTCGLTVTGKAYCWGAGGHGALGNDGDRNYSIPVAVSSPNQYATTFSSLSAGYGYTCGLSSQGIAYCWGDNAFGKLGTGNTLKTFVAIAVENPKSGTPLVFKRISAGYDHACGLDTKGAAYCWGLNKDGALGNGSTSDSNRPVAVAAPAGESRLKFSSISAGTGLSCGLTLNGNAYCWGHNSFGALGNNSTTNSSLPVRVLEPEGVKGLRFSSVTAGANHSCALTLNGKAYCWGWNKFGALGNGTTKNSSIPVAVNIQGIDDMALLNLTASGFRTCSLSMRGKIHCWG